MSIVGPSETPPPNTPAPAPNSGKIAFNPLTSVAPPVSLFTPSTYPLAFNSLPIRVSDPDAPANQATLLNTLQLNSALHSTELTSSGVLSDATTTTWSSIGSTVSNTVALAVPSNSSTLNVINKVVVEDSSSVPTKSKVVLDASDSGGSSFISTVRDNLANEILTLTMGSLPSSLIISGSSTSENRPFNLDKDGHVFVSAEGASNYGSLTLASDAYYKSLNLGNVSCAVDASTALSFTLPSNATASTKSPGDNTTQVATTAYVDTAVANLNIYPVPVFKVGNVVRTTAENENFLFVEISDLVVGKYYSVNANSLFTAMTAFSIGSIQGGLYDGNTGTPNVINGIQVIDPRNSFQTSNGYKFSENVSGVFHALTSTAYFGIGYTTVGTSVNFSISYNISIVQV